MRAWAIACGLSGALAATALPAQVPAAPGGASSHAVAVAVKRQRDEVKQLQHDVAAKEAGSRDAVQRLQQRDAKIAELQRQLQAVHPPAAGSSTGR